MAIIAFGHYLRHMGVTQIDLRLYWGQLLPPEQERRSRCSRGVQFIRHRHHSVWEYLAHEPR